MDEVDLSRRRGGGGGGGDRGAPVVPAGRTARPPPARSTLSIPREMPHVYTECASIWNPIHTDPRSPWRPGCPASSCTAPRPGARGARGAAALCRADPRRLRRLHGRFRGWSCPEPTSRSSTARPSARSTSWCEPSRRARHRSGCRAVDQGHGVRRPNYGRRGRRRPSSHPIHEPRRCAASPATTLGATGPTRARDQECSRSSGWSVNNESPPTTARAAIASRAPALAAAAAPGRVGRPRRSPRSRTAEPAPAERAPPGSRSRREASTAEPFVETRPDEQNPRAALDGLQQ